MEQHGINIENCDSDLLGKHYALFYAHLKREEHFQITIRANRFSLRYLGGTMNVK